MCVMIGGVDHIHRFPYDDIEKKKPHPTPKADGQCEVCGVVFSEFQKLHLKEKMGPHGG